jgi:hypothetical protein
LKFGEVSWRRYSISPSPRGILVSDAIQMNFEPVRKSQNFEKNVGNIHKLVNLVWVLAKNEPERRTPKWIWTGTRVPVRTGWIAPLILVPLYFFSHPITCKTIQENMKMMNNAIKILLYDSTALDLNFLALFSLSYQHLHAAIFSSQLTQSVYSKFKNQRLKKI